MKPMPVLFASIVVAMCHLEGAAAEPQIQFRKSIEVNDGALRGVAISPNGKLIACCGDQFVHLFDAKSGNRLNRLDGHTGAVNHVAFAPDGKLLASAGEDQTIRLWDIETGKSKGLLKQSIQARKVPQTCLAFSAEGKTLASCSSARSEIVWLWDVEKARWEHIVNTPHRDGCWHVTFSPDGKYIAAAGGNQKAGQVSLHVEDDGPRFVSSWKHDGEESATCVAFSPDGKRLLSSGSDNTIRVWEVPQGRELLKLHGPKGANGIRAATFTPDGARIISITRNEKIQVWQADGGALLGSYNGSDQNVRALAMSRDGRLLATCGDSQVIKLWDVDPSDTPEVDSRPTPAPKEIRP